MAIDPRIALGVQPLQIQQQDPNANMNALARMMQINSSMQEADLGRLKMQELQRGVERRNKLDSIVSQKYARPEDLEAAVLQGGFIEEHGKLAKDRREAMNSDATRQKTELETALKKTEHMASMLSLASPQNWSTVRSVVKAQLGQDLPEQFDPQWVQASLAGGQTLSERLKSEHDRLTRTETGRHNLATEANTVRGQNMVDARARESASIQRQGLDVQRQAARTEIRESADGFVMVDKGTKEVTPLKGPDGKPIGPRLKDAPPAVQQAVLSNATNLARAERALKLVGGEDIGDPAKGGQKGDKEATGWKGYLPNQVLNRIDPTGVDARAAIADLGSLVIHDRSGAAVTAAEFPRLAPFIPTEKDDAATVKKKLQRFVQVYREEITAAQGAYNPETGYRTPKAPSGSSIFDAADRILNGGQ